MSNIDSQEIPQQTSIVEWAVARHNVKPNSEPKYMQAVVKSTPSGFMIAVISGVRTDKQGEIAAQIGHDVFESFTHQRLTDLFNRCDRESKETGGSSISAAIFNTSYHTVSWFGVGNVQGLLYHRSPAAQPRFHRLLLQPGFVGDGEFTFREATNPVRYGDLLILATEGLQPEFVEALPIEGKPRIVADTLLPKYVRPEEDSLVLVTRYLGGM